MSNIKAKIARFQIPYLKKQGDQIYGTSGYRTHPDILPYGRTALVAYMRSSTLAGKHIGILITASHNPAQDNGIKLIDHTGEMFDTTWEIITDKIVNSPDKELYTELNKTHRNYGNFRPFGDGPRANILLGRDNRESGQMISSRIMEVLKNLNCQVTDYEEVSTPQLHWLVNQCNQKNKLVDKLAYFDPLVDFIKFSDLKNSLRVDTSNGVVKVVLEKLNEYLEKKEMTFTLKEDFSNNESEEVKRLKSSLFILTNETGPINHNCGAQHIQYVQAVPDHLKDMRGEFVAFDGDADRIIYFEIKEPEENTSSAKKKVSIQTIDGDRQASILIRFFIELTRSIGLTSRIGCVLSDYSNLSAVNYCVSLCETVRGRTGIKNLIKSAKEYDIGVFNEPNGHGGVFFSSKIIQQVEQILSETENGESEKYRNAQLLDKIIKIFIDGYADPLCNLLILEYVKMTDPKLFEPNYTPFPCRQLAVHVKDQTVVTLDGNLAVASPIPLKTLIDKIISTEKVRVFVRGSGTEQIVRVFCEAERDVDILCLTVAQAVYDICDGTGPHPEISYL